MSRQANAILLAIALTVLMVFAVAGQSRLSGPVIFTFSRSHGVHRDDLIALAAWIAGMWCVSRIPRR